jgi:Flp pilus assembly protein TadG
MASSPQDQRETNETQSGSSIIEFIFLVVLLLVPLVYLVVGASQVQAASYAAVGAADHAAKVFVTAQSEGQGRARAADAVQRAAANLGIGSGRTNFSYSCQGTCLSPGSTVTIQVSVETVLPLLPQGWSWRTGSVGSNATQRVDRYG